MNTYAKFVQMHLEEERALEAEREELMLEIESRKNRALLNAISMGTVGATTDYNRSRPTVTDNSRNSSQKSARGKQSPAKSSAVLKLERELRKKPRWASLVKG